MNLELPKKSTFRVDGQKIVLQKKAFESDFHIWAKVLVYALYLRKYPALTIELKIEDRYKPDLVAFNETGGIIFWAECGAVKPEKILKIFQKYHQSHFVFVKKPTQFTSFVSILKKIVTKLKRPPVIELIKFPDNFDQFVDAKGEVGVTREDLDIIAL